MNRLNLKKFSKNLIRGSLFEPVHMGWYIRRLYFWREVEKLPVGSFKKVLDAGCGSGQYAIEFARKFPHVDVHGVDLELPHSNQSLPSNCQLYQGNLLELKNTEQYDFIWCIDVLEHIPGNEKALINLITALRHGGFLFIHVPYDKLGKRVFPDNWFVNFNEWAVEEHIGKQMPLDEWKALLERAGVIIINAEWTYGFWGELAWEIDRLTDGKSYLKYLLTPFLKAMANLALSTSGSEKRGNVLLVGKKHM